MLWHTNCITMLLGRNLGKELEKLEDGGLLTRDNDVEKDNLWISLTHLTNADQTIGDFDDALKEDVTAILDAYSDLNHNVLPKTVYYKYPAFAKKAGEQRPAILE